MYRIKEERKGLTPTEKRLMEFLLYGLSNKEIGEKMFISVSTVKKHMESIFYKLNVHNRLQAIVKFYINPDIDFLEQKTLLED